MIKSGNKLPISLRSYQGKKLVSYLRNGDYAHAGETESIIQVMSRFPKNMHNNILDAGCGLGGTSYFIEKNAWGKVTGIDIESDSISYAKKNYPSVEFHVSDIENFSNLFPDKKFDLICLFNSFYAINNQRSALLSLCNATNRKGNMAIFDYSDPLMGRDTPLFKEGNQIVTPFKPIKIQNVRSLLSSCGWCLSEMLDISQDYIRWYSSLINKLSDNKEFIISEFGQAAFEKAQKTYSDICDAIMNKTLGGIIIYAEKES